MKEFLIINGLILTVFIIMLYLEQKRNQMKCSKCNKRLNEYELMYGCIPCELILKELDKLGLKVPTGYKPIRARSLSPKDEFQLVYRVYQTSDNNYIVHAIDETKIVYRRINATESEKHWRLFFFGINSMEIVLKRI